MGGMRLLVPVFLFITASVIGGEADAIPKPVKVGQLPDDVVRESSGLVRGTRHPERRIYWTLNDSGDVARIIAIDETGKLLRDVAIPGATNVDWEELAIDEQGRLIIADIGDNLRRRKSITLYRLPEPDALNDKEEIKPPEEFCFNYPEQNVACDAEALFVRGDAAYLFSKSATGTRVFLLDLSGDVKGVRVAKQLDLRTDLGLLTGAAISPDGRHVALLNYVSIAIYDLGSAFEKQEVVGERTVEKAAQASIAALFKAPRRNRISFLGQTEAIAWDGADLVLTTEGGAIYRISDAVKVEKK
jgi:hypothetical protein